ncbi:MAG: transglycosylase SLT domain-containing protein [Chitinispirillaceae bacterium]
MKASMHIISRQTILFLLLVFCIQADVPQQAFPVPDIIKENVAFWIRIYTEVSLKEGLLHDREYPQIVYGKIRTGDMLGKKRSDFIDRKRDEIARSIGILQDSSQKKWGKQEKEIAALFKLAPDGALKGAEKRIRFQTGQKERFKSGLERSSMYLDTIAAILKQHDMPEQLKYLPHVESSFDPKAYSKAGAAGLWQFMRPTGKSYLRIDYLFDERRDPILSTYAAVKFLKSNFNMFQSWPLAITAYNYGPNGIRRAVRSLGSNDIALILEKHESASFKFASKNFYSCFVAVLQIAENPSTYFKTIKWQSRFQAISIELPSGVNPSLLCESLGIAEQTFKDLNPSIRPVVFRYQRLIPKGYKVNLPLEMNPIETVALLRKLPKQQSPSGGGYYTVVKGDNLYTIARRFGVSMNDLAEVNNITRRGRIYVGQVLLIPCDDTGKDKILIARKAEKSKKEEQSKEQNVTRELEQTEEKIFDESVPADSLKSTIFKEAVPDPSPESSEKPTLSTHFDAEVYDLGMTVAPGASTVKIRVSVGETIGHFAEWMGITASQIRRHNNMEYGKPIYWGSNISLPIGSSSDLKKFEVERLEYHMAIEEDFFIRFELTGLEKRTIRSGESLWRICTDAQIPLWLLKKYNPGADLLSLKQGDNVWIPQTVAKDSHIPQT